MSQIEKNTVSAQNQLQESNYIRFINPNGKGKRVLFVGNSITRHGVKEEIGWYHDFGMAASAAEHDYVHLVADTVSRLFPDAAFCICQAAAWETNYRQGEQYLPLFQSAREFGADLVIMRLIENCKTVDFDHAVFSKEYALLVDYLNPNHAGVIFTSGFWKHVGDEDIRKAAEKSHSPFLYLGDLGENDDMKAIGLFAHSGVAAHPGDRGMQAIAERICDSVKTIWADENR